jgi:hypothetical protein
MTLLPFRWVIPVLFLGCALPGCGATEETTMDELLGAWRVEKYEVWDSTGAQSSPFGSRPSGYAVFDAAGIAFIQMMGTTDRGEPQPLLYASYYGPFQTDSARTTLTILVEGSNLPAYVGTEQVRPYSVVEDTLYLGIPGEYRATLARVSNGAWAR